MTFNPVTTSATAETLGDLPKAIRVLLQNYFQLLSRGDGGMTVKCNFCKNDRPMKGDEKITSNYTRHLKVRLSRELNSFRCKRLSLIIIIGKFVITLENCETDSNF